MPSHLVAIKHTLFENIFNHAPNGIAVMGLDFRWIRVNQSLMDLLGYSEDEFYAMTFPDITHKDDIYSDKEQLGQLLNGTIQRYQIEKRYFHKTGKLIWVILSVSLEISENGVPLYFVIQTNDVTRQREMLIQMTAFTTIANIQNERLKDFAHIATHDLRTHLGNLGVITDFMQEDLPGIAQNDNFMMLREALSQLESTITDLNEVRNSDFGAQEQTLNLNLREFVDNSIYNINAIALHQKCHIINQVSDSFNVLGIPVYLNSIILNLLTNAIKYSSKERSSYVQLSSKIVDDFVVLEVSDNGLGINMEAHRHELFQFQKTFHQSADSRGIGLFITKNHVESMGGQITVESRVNVGTTFRVFFRKAPPKGRGLHKKKPHALEHE
ncbi:PAS domain S-box protein [Gelidibacter salicanalis]|uniref:histidine kinase n=1 Tax=Gelidibacter salicanalis TaxID=291193 RepID=A0A5C7AP08_9FLAO|nr:HAMP domain-containing sensor histidine kinase [Gelidibacter salicanalis]TXE09313.1 PAS domain S-box protein [Gelidibacter salicanalis]